MRKILAFSALIASIGFAALPPEAKAAETVNSSAMIAVASAAAEGQQIIIQPGRRRNRNWRNNRGARVITRSRIVRVGFRTYREIYQVRYLPNGRMTTRIISRTRIR